MPPEDPADVRQALDLLRIEHDLAVAIGLDNDPVYMADLEHQMATWEAAWEAAWIGAAVTEAAVSRAASQGRLQG